ncbi:unnamed protein product [Vicia faba]|uniref:Uncharacterized protein n=1 Tax=Vicia faba TaxID=3906 RepID=A0AAV0Z8Y3_VICFA|nr:unnamed protein product [Vicia faba]
MLRCKFVTAKHGLHTLLPIMLFFFLPFLFISIIQRELSIAGVPAVIAAYVAVWHPAAQYVGCSDGEEKATVLAVLSDCEKFLDRAASILFLKKNYNFLSQIT